jgi:hypothetical protein
MLYGGSNNSKFSSLVTEVNMKFHQDLDTDKHSRHSKKDQDINSQMPNTGM